MNTHPIPKGLALLSTGLLAGAFYYATSNVLPTFSEVPTDIHLAFRTALMKHNAMNMQLLMASSILTSAWLAWSIRLTREAFYIALLGSLMALTSLLVTRFGNVPINMQIKTWSIASQPQDWLETLIRWDLFHTIRSYAAIGSFICAVVACQFTNIFSKKQAQTYSERGALEEI
jgi:uncharacterized membrane protein